MKLSVASLLALVPPFGTAISAGGTGRLIFLSCPALVLFFINHGRLQAGEELARRIPAEHNVRYLNVHTRYVRETSSMPN